MRGWIAGLQDFVRSIEEGKLAALECRGGEIDDADN